MTINASGAKRAAERIRAYAVSLADFAPLWTEVGAEVAQAEAEWFASSGGGTWAPLSAEYAGEKGALFPGKPILIATGELQDSIINPQRAMKITSPESMEWRSDVVTPTGDWNLASLHRDGTPTMQARNPVIPLARIAQIAYAAARIHAAWI